MNDRIETDALPQYKNLLESFVPKKITEGEQRYIGTIIDLETGGLNTKTHRLCQIALLSFAFSLRDGVLEILEKYEHFQETSQLIPSQVVQLTHISNSQVAGEEIEWDQVKPIVESSDYLFCFNSRFDRKFLEKDPPEDIQALIRSKRFGCVYNDINWDIKGFKSKKLVELNRALGFIYDAHDAGKDCLATLNLLVEVDGTIPEMMCNLEKTQTLLFVPSEFLDEGPKNLSRLKNNLLKKNNFRWSKGEAKDYLPKGWYRYVDESDVPDVKKWLDECIYGKKGESNRRPHINGITAVDRYSIRAETLPVPPKVEESPLLRNSTFNKRSSEDSQNADIQQGLDNHKRAKR